VGGWLEPAIAKRIHHQTTDHTGVREYFVLNTSRDTRQKGITQSSYKQKVSDTAHEVTIGIYSSSTVGRKGVIEVAVVYDDSLTGEDARKLIRSAAINLMGVSDEIGLSADTSIAICMNHQAKFSSSQTACVQNNAPFPEMPQTPSTETPLPTLGQLAQLDVRKTG